MKISVSKEAVAGEKRVALVPDAVGRLIKKGHQVIVERGAGEGAGFRDEDYQKAGASLGSLKDGEVVLSIHRPDPARLAAGQTLVSLFYALSNPDQAKIFAGSKINVIAVEMIPRTTLAQSMDVLSSQANIAGYWAVVAAAGRLPKLFPMLMTAAGTIAPAKVLVLGAGVAGLQAVATARRLGAVVEVFDVRKAVKEQVQSLGAKFVEVADAEDLTTAGGYAKEASAEYQAKQKALIQKHIAKSDVVITTALIPGKRAPILITDAMVQGMRPGSVIVDLAADQGGNTEGCEPGAEVVRHGVTVVGLRNVASFLSVHASQMYSKNMENLLGHFSTKEGALRWDLKDEIISGCTIVKDGEVIHPQVKGAS